MHLLTSKPTMYIANVDEDGLAGKVYLDELRRIADNEGAAIVPVCTKIEAEIAELSKEETSYFRILDLDNDNFVSLEEISQSTNLIFQLIDKNKDNKISLLELEELKDILDLLK